MKIYNFRLIVQLRFRLKIYNLKCEEKNFRRGAGVAERGGLENRCPACGTESSNLSLSAKKNYVVNYHRHRRWLSFISQRDYNLLLHLRSVFPVLPDTLHISLSFLHLFLLCLQNSPSTRSDFPNMASPSSIFSSETL